MTLQRSASPLPWILGIGAAVLGAVALLAVAGAGVATWLGSLPPAEQPVLGKGSAFGDEASYGFWIYYLPEPTSDPLAAFERAVAEEPALALRDHAPEGAPGRESWAVLESDLSELAPPDLDTLRYSGRGLSDEQASAVQGSRRVLILSQRLSRDHVFTGGRAACKVALVVARKTGGLIWDEETRELFSPDAWEEKRVTRWKETLPTISDHTTIHVYQHDEYPRAVSLGLGKFALPDLVVEELSWSNQRVIGHVVNLTAQLLAEGAEVGDRGQFDLELAGIRSTAVREAARADLHEGAKEQALLTLREGVRDEGDSENRLVELCFDRHPGNDDHARQESMVKSLFGATDAIVRIEHDDELLAASERARAKLPRLRSAFLAGLEPGELLLLKAPFEIPEGGNEWMWVEVTGWRGDTIDGLLDNEPFEIPDLHAGQKISVSQADIFDYIRQRPDGTSEGNETGQIMEARQAAAPSE